MGEDKRDCPNAGSCEMFRLFTLSGALGVWKINYCSADFSRCARYQRSCSGRPVPINLMPNGDFLKRPGDPQR